MIRVLQFFSWLDKYLFISSKEKKVEEKRDSFAWINKFLLVKSPEK